MQKCYDSNFLKNMAGLFHERNIVNGFAIYILKSVQQIKI